jgi:hypothetical protein
MQKIQFNFDLSVILSIFKKKRKLDKIICNDVVFQSDGIYFQVMKPNSISIGWIKVPCNLAIENPVTVACQPLIEALNDKSYKNLVFEFDTSLTITYKTGNETSVKEVSSEFISYASPKIPIVQKTTMLSQNFFQALDYAAFALSSDYTDSPFCDFALHENFVVAVDRILLTSQLNVTIPYFEKPFILCRQIAALLPKTGAGLLGTFDIESSENNSEKTTGLLINTMYKKIPIQYFVVTLPNRFPTWKKIFDTESRFVPLCNISKYDAHAIMTKIDSLPTDETEGRKYILISCRNNKVCVESYCDDKENKRLVCSEKSISQPLLNKFAVALRIDALKGFLAKKEDIQIKAEIKTKDNTADETKDNTDENYEFDKIGNQLVVNSDSYNAAIIPLGFTPTDTNIQVQGDNTFVYKKLQKAKEVTEVIDLS